MPDRRYIPSAYVDETCPPGRLSPNDWIGAPSGDRWWLAPWDEDEEPDTTFAPGDVVEFTWVVRLGEVRVEIRDDGTHAALDPVPEGANTFTFGMEVIGDSLADFVAQWRDCGLELDNVAAVRVAQWSKDGEHFQFTVDDRGPRFIRAPPGRDGEPADDGRARL